MPSVGDSIDRYVIEAVIGEGGMGRVYRALDPRLGRRVALKILLADGTNEKVRTEPENVMVMTDGVVKILDFGIARRTEDPAVDSGAPTAAAHLASLTAEGMMIGTPQYMPPEQLQGEPLDGRADQFAWGVMAWELFAGVLPWGASKNGAQLVAAVLATPVRPLRDVVPGVEQAVSDAVARALSKNRDTRFKTMEELLVAFEGKRALAPLPSSQDVAFQPTAAQPSAPGTSRQEATPTKPSERPPSGAGGPLTTGAAGSVARTGDPLAAPRRGRSAMPVVVTGVVVAGAAAIAFALGVAPRKSVGSHVGRFDRSDRRSPGRTARRSVR
jgi:eukaryotic-like serine/threonine-protein kinase